MHCLEYETYYKSTNVPEQYDRTVGVAYSTNVPTQYDTFVLKRYGAYHKGTNVP